MLLESRVESGGIDLHPIKRARSTFTYLAVAIAGSDAQKAAFRRAVNQAHAELYSTPESPLHYNAFTQSCSCGWRHAYTKEPPTSTGPSSARWTTRTPNAITARA